MPPEIPYRQQLLLTGGVKHFGSSSRSLSLTEPLKSGVNVSPGALLFQWVLNRRGTLISSVRGSLNAHIVHNIRQMAIRKNDQSNTTTIIKKQSRCLLFENALLLQCSALGKICVRTSKSENLDLLQAAREEFLLTRSRVGWLVG